MISHAIPAHTQRAVKKAMDDTKDNDGLILNFALNYGSRAEILKAVNNVLKDVEQGKVKEKITEDNFLTVFNDGYFT